MRTETAVSTNANNKTGEAPQITGGVFSLCDFGKIPVTNIIKSPSEEGITLTANAQTAHINVLVFTKLPVIT
jgi:hypothetical protein